MNLELWELVGALMAMLIVMSGLAMFFFKKYLDRSEAIQKRENQEFKDAAKADTREFREDTLTLFESVKSELKDFRKHFDASVTQIYLSIDTKNKELRDLVSKELEYFRNHISSIESKMDVTRERSHEIEKDLLRLQSSIGKDYITKDDLEAYMLRGK